MPTKAIKTPDTTGEEPAHEEIQAPDPLDILDARLSRLEYLLQMTARGRALQESDFPEV